MSTDNTSSAARRSKRRVTGLLVVLSFGAVWLCSWVLPGVFDTWHAQTVDQVYRLRNASTLFRPPYDSTVVHVDLTNSALQKLDDFYLNRGHFSRVVRNLAAMGVSAQVHDFIFAARVSDAFDNALIQATQSAGHVYFGLAFELLQGEASYHPFLNAASAQYLERTKWSPVVKGDPEDLYTGANPLVTYPDLAAASRGLGFANVLPDRDGVYRRMPLLVRYGDAYYPSLPFRVICDYLRVPPERIVIEPGVQIVLKYARRPGEDTGHDMAIPIDRHGSMAINFIGPWERMTHYNFEDIIAASDDRTELEMWSEELKGKIVVISDITTGSSDVGPAPGDARFPLSGVLANLMHTILSEDFIYTPSSGQVFLVDMLLLAVMLVLSLRSASRTFSLGAAGILVGYAVLAVLCFLYASVALPTARPLLMLAVAMLSVLVYRYIGEEKEKEVLKRLSEADRLASERKSRFLADMSHELRTPMNAIIGFTNLVLRRSGSALPARQKENLEKVIQSADRLLTLINGLLDLSRIEAGRMDVNAERFDIRKLIAGCCAEVEPLVKPGVALGYDVPEDIGDAHTDRNRLRHIVMNLLGNALKFTETGEVAVRVWKEGGRDDGAFLLIAVSDTGSGIPADALETIFEEFQQVKGSDPQHKGTGLGLPIAKGFAELLGGWISVESDVGSGSTFTVRMPVVYRTVLDLTQRRKDAKKTRD